MSISWTYRVQNLSLRLWRRVPGWLRVRLKGINGLWSRPFSAGGESVAPIQAHDVQGATILCFPIIDWGMRIQRPQQLLARLAAKGHRVYYVSKDFREARTASLTALARNVSGLALPGRARLNIYRESPTSRDVEACLAALETVRQSEGLDSVVSLVQWPFWTPLALAARERWGWKVIYDCLDEHSGYEVAAPEVLELEQALIGKSDLVLATSKRLFEKCSRTARRCQLLGNAGDFEHFHRPSGKRVLAGLSGPVIGYYGALAEWFATEFVEAATRAHPEWQFVLIGLNSGAELRGVARLGNVHLLGERPYATLPDFLHRFDVATIPFRLDRLTRATNPIKFFEYLSAGKPVVAADLPELDAYRDLIYVARTPDEFVTQIERALAERDPDVVARREALARSNTWDDRVAVLESLIAEL